MNFDFQAFMVIALVVLGAIWAIDSMVYAPRRRKLDTVNVDGDSETGLTELAEPKIVEYSRSFFPIILVVLVLRSFLVEPFRIPSESMLPTLLWGDFILVNKYSYGVRLPLFGNKIIDVGEPSRGDVVVFKYPKDPSKNYIKRVIGLPGDRIEYINKVLYINGKRMNLEPMGSYLGDGESYGWPLIKERLETVDHNILVNRIPAARAYPFLGEDGYTVPEGHYFMMGDNRDNSNDSRFWGTVPEENLVGKAFMIWMSWDAYNGGINLNRIGSDIE
ncbi:MAG: signal peptidase I [Gammaproteobacteria bacterium]